MARPRSPEARALGRRLLVASALTAALLALLVATCSREPRREEIRLLAPLPLAAAAEGLAAEFEAAYPGTLVAVTTGAPAALAREIGEGRADVLLSADAGWLAALGREGRLRQPPQTLFADRLVVVARERGARLDSLPQLRGLGRLAVADTAAGSSARAGLEEAGLWDALRSRIVLEGGPAGALAAVREGRAEAALVHASDTLGARDVGPLVEWPSGVPPIQGEAAVLLEAPHPERALELVEFARQPERASLWRLYGLSPLGASEGGARWGEMP